MDTVIHDWWKATLLARETDGYNDAGRGIYDPPYPHSEDPTDDEENFAYRRGFDKRRHELGEEFTWS